MLIDEREESILVHQDCFAHLREGMILFQGRADSDAEKIWSDRVPETLSRLVGNAGN